MFTVFLHYYHGSSSRVGTSSLCASESPHSAQGLQKPSTRTSLMDKGINEAISQCRIPRRMIAGLSSQEIYSKKSTSLGQRAPSTFLLRSHVSTGKARADDSFSSDGAEWSLCSRQRDQSWVLTLAHFKQMQGGHFFSEVSIASGIQSVAQMNKPTLLSWLPQQVLINWCPEGTH